MKCCHCCYWFCPFLCFNWMAIWFFESYKRKLFLLVSLDLPLNTLVRKNYHYCLFKTFSRKREESLFCVPFFKWKDVYLFKRALSNWIKCICFLSVTVGYGTQNTMIKRKFRIILNLCIQTIFTSFSFELLYVIWCWEIMSFCLTWTEKRYLFMNIHDHIF